MELHPNQLQAEKLTPRESQVSALIREIEVPFLTKVKSSLAADAPRYCGPAAIALAHILSQKLNIPIGRNLNGEYLEIAVGIYDSENPDDRLRKIQIEEQTFIKYHSSNETVLYIDPTNRIFFEGRAIGSGSILIEKYTPENIDENLHRKYKLNAFRSDYPNISYVSVFADCRTPADNQAKFDDLLGAMNDQRALLSNFVSDAGKTRLHLNWGTVPEIIADFIPGFSVDSEFKLDQMSQASEAMLKGVRHRPDNPTMEPLSDSVAAAMEKAMINKMRKSKNQNMRKMARMVSRDFPVYQDAPIEAKFYTSDNTDGFLSFVENGVRYLLNSNSFVVGRVGESLAIDDEIVDRFTQVVAQSADADVKKLFDRYRNVLQNHLKDAE